MFILMVLLREKTLNLNTVLSLRVTQNAAMRAVCMTVTDLLPRLRG